MPTLNTPRITCSLAEATGGNQITYTEEATIVPLGITLLKPSVYLTLTGTVGADEDGTYNVTLHFSEDRTDTPFTINFEETLSFDPHLIVDFTDVSVVGLHTRVYTMDIVEMLEVMLMQNSQIKITKNGTNDDGSPEYIIIFKSPLIQRREISSLPLEKQEVQALIGK